MTQYRPFWYQLQLDWCFLNCFESMISYMILHMILSMISFIYDIMYIWILGNFLPPTMSYVTYDVVRHVRTTGTRAQSPTKSRKRCDESQQDLYHWSTDQLVLIR